MERTISIINIKKHKNTEFKLEDQFVAFIGKNRSGKSTVSQVIQTIMQVKGFMVDPVSHGADVGEVTYKGKDREGNPIVIVWTVLGGKSTFKATRLDKDGKSKPVNGIENIRSLIGTYCPYSTQDALTMMNSTEGRKKFYDNVIKLCLTPKESKEIEDIDIAISGKKNSATEGNLFHTRTEKNSELKTLEAIIDQSLDDEEKDLLEKEELIRKSLKDMKASYEKIQEINDAIVMDMKDVESINSFLSSIKDDYKKTAGLSPASDEAFNIFTAIVQDDVKKINESIKDRETDINEIIELYKEDDEQFFDMSAVIENGVSTIARIDTIKKQQEKQVDNQEKYNILETEVEQLTFDIEDMRKRKAEIISNSNLPAGLTIDEEYRLSLDGFLFDETSTSDSQSKLAMLKLLDKVSTADFIDIGDWSLFDSDAKKEILETFKGKDRIIIGQLVTEDAEVKTKVIIEE